MPSTDNNFELLRGFVLELHYHLHELPNLLADVFTTFILPFLLLLASLALVSLLVLRLKRILIPPTPGEMHVEALLALQRKHQPKDTTATSLAHMQRCLQTHPEYVPLRLSLAALLLYRMGAAEQALAVLRPVQDRNVAQSLILDAKALKGGCSTSMIQTPLREEEYLSPSFAQRELLLTRRRGGQKTKVV